MRPAVFLDRDGTLIEDRHYLADPAGVVLLPGVPEGLRRLGELGFLLVVVSNQSGVARGLMTEKEVRATNDAVAEALRREGAGVDAFYYCPHHPTIGREPYVQACACRKPAPGMILAAAEALDISLPDSVVVGDKVDDLELGARLGLPAYLVLTGKGAESAASPAAAGAAKIVQGLLDVAAHLAARGEGGGK
jgi:D-glycero-D-manno-heptose 1,7-bisphosphate phosphatase